MTKYSLGVLNVNKILTIKHPIIKINYISGVEFSLPANNQGEFFEWNYKLIFEIIKDRTSFFMQCYNNNSDDCSNLIGETRIPLIFAIENEKFKQWYPIYLREKRNKFACKGEILIDLQFYSNEKLMRNNLNFSTLIKDKLNYKPPKDNQKDNSSIIKSSKSCSSNSSYKSLISDKSELHIQSPTILPRPPRNSSYASNSISKYSNHDLKNNPIGNIKNETVYNNNFLNDKYNDSNIYPKYKKVVDSQYRLSLNQLNEISKSYIPNLPVKSETNEKVLISLPKSSILSPSFIHKSSPQIKKVVIPTESDILLNKRLSITTTTTNTTVATTSDSSTLCFTSISSNINNNLNESLPNSLQNTSINDKYIQYRTYSNDFSNLKRNWSSSSILPSFSYSPIPKYSISNTIYDKSLNDIIIMNHSKSCELKFYKNEDDIQMETKSFHSMRNVPSNNFKPYSASTFPIVKNHLNDINRIYLSINDDNFNEEENNYESQVHSQQNKKYEEINKLKHKKSSNSITFKQEKNFTLDELTPEEQEFITKLNKKYNKKFILIDEKDTLLLSKENIFNNKLNFMTEIILDESRKTEKKDDDHINTSSHHSKKTSKKIFKNLLSLKYAIFNTNNERYKSSIEPLNFIKSNSTGNYIDINTDVKSAENTLPEVEFNNENTIKNNPTRSSTEFSYETLTSIKDFNNSYDYSIKNTNVLNDHYQKKIDNKSLFNSIKPISDVIFFLFFF
ncbi:hypothetical protein U3516DRAFT_542158 [Neocallimastix sp. 'constans']